MALREQQNLNALTRHVDDEKQDRLKEVAQLPGNAQTGDEVLWRGCLYKFIDTRWFKLLTTVDLDASDGVTLQASNGTPFTWSNVRDYAADQNEIRVPLDTISEKGTDQIETYTLQLFEDQAANTKLNPNSIYANLARIEDGELVIDPSQIDASDHITLYAQLTARTLEEVTLYL